MTATINPTETFPKPPDSRVSGINEDDTFRIIVRGFGGLALNTDATNHQTVNISGMLSREPLDAMMAEHERLHPNENLALYAPVTNHENIL